MRRTLIALALCLALGLAGCAHQSVPTPEQPETTPTPTPAAAATAQEFVLPYFPNGELHPILGSNRINMVLTGLVYEGLFELDNSFTPHGVLCSGYSVSDDGLIWTFTLGNKTFSDGTAVTAADVVFSLETARSSTLYAGRLADVQKISAGTDGTVVLTLTRPNARLHALLDIPVIRDFQDGSMPLGTGPYRFVEDDGPLRLVREAFAPVTAPEEIPLLALDGADDLIYAFDAGNISLVVSDLTGANSLGYSMGYEAFDFPTTTMLYVGFQTTAGPCAEAVVRQAISRAFDRDTVAASLLAGHAEATCLPFPARSALHNTVREQMGEYDPNATLALLGDAGYAAGEDGLLYRSRTPLSLTFVVNTDNPFKVAVADYLTGQLTGLGINVTLKKLAWEEFLNTLEQGEFDLYLGEVTLSADFDLTALMGTDGALNYGGYTNEKTDAVLNLARISERNASVLLNQFQSEMPFAPLCFKSQSVLTQWQAVSGLQSTRQNLFYLLESLRFDAVK